MLHHQRNNEEAHLQPFRATIVIVNVKLNQTNQILLTLSLSRFSKATLFFGGPPVLIVDAAQKLFWGDIPHKYCRHSISLGPFAQLKLNLLQNSLPQSDHCTKNSFQ